MAALAALPLFAFHTNAVAEVAHRPQPREAVQAILDAFQTHALVALGEYHGNLQTHAFRLSLLRHPAFAATVDTIVVEFGNARYQAIVDKYVAGEAIERDALAKVWQDTGIPHGVWDVPMYQETYEAIRSINRDLPPHRKLRVLLGDPPMDWSTVRSRDDLAKWRASRDSYAANLIAKEVVNQGHKALLLYGSWHIDRAASRSDDVRMLTLLEANNPARVFSVDLSTNVTDDLLSAEPAARSWPVPSLIFLDGTPLGAYVAASEQNRPTPLPLKQHYDAVIYLGPQGEMTQSKLSLELITDPAYQQMRMVRTILALLPP
ncbi:ChaN family lipoprotein [Steroidobacter sp.]|uniref:ChaN family lipoprotein n=1 Tax=Steroidobacter sp. TaxID=1978227 RepID=UPI001A61DAC2|nr:ChaN family lipoprotein [Steroidobacter sp.]MBL8268795.1 ChaN family lipoprotein [Steroidobacter sp.]